MKTLLLASALMMQSITAPLVGLVSVAHGSQVLDQAPVERPTFVQNGLATWYGAGHAGRKTASGEYFDVHALSAAHRTLPFGTVVRVTDVESGRVVKVRINDRGPNSRAVLDLSESAALVLNMQRRGVSRVRIEAFASDQGKTLTQRTAANVAPDEIGGAHETEKAGGVITLSDDPIVGAGR